MLPASAPAGRGSPVCDASPGTRPARLRPVPADSITVQLATPGHGQPGLAAGQAGHQPPRFSIDPLTGL